MLEGQNKDLAAGILSGQDQDKRMLFNWNLTFECNYRCPYCWFYGQWADLKDVYKRPVKELLKYWSNIYKKYGSVDIKILGGEPFLYPDFSELVKELSEMHHVRITTNLSCDISSFVKNSNTSERCRVGIISSYHPLFAHFQDFLRKALILKENGFGSTIAYVAYPPQISHIEYLSKRFGEEGLSLSVSSFWGKYKGLDYPASYTEEEREFLAPYLGNWCEEKFQLKPRTFKGLLCNAGHRYAVIFEDGRMFRCGGLNSDKKDTTIGNFYSGSFDLLKGAEPCSFEHCPCNEWVFLLCNRDKAEGDTAIAARDSIPPYRVFFSWYINTECDYKCSYCKPEDLKTAFVDVKKWIDVWDEVYNKYGSCNIHFSGGEPFLYPRFMKLIKKLSKKHTLEFSTNLSIDIGPFIKAVGPERARLGGSFHPGFSNFDDFLRKVSLLHKHKYEVWVNYVAYPPHLKDMERYKQAVEALGIRFSIQPFNGEHEGRHYPGGYTDDEKLIMNSGHVDEVNRETIDWRTDNKKSSTKGRLCRMGQMYARIYPDAEVYRCCGNGALRLGNMLDGTFKLLEEPLPCECDNCPCHKCMLADKEKYWPTFWGVAGRANLKRKFED